MKKPSRPNHIGDAAKAYQKRATAHWGDDDGAFSTKHHWTNHILRRWLVWAFRAGALWERRRAKKR